MGETLWRRLVRGVRRLHCQPRWPEFAGPDWADRIMGLPLGDRFHAKQGRTIARWTLESGGRRLTVYLKRHYRLPRWQGLLSLAWPGARCSPALREWDHLQWARAEGLPVPEAAAAGEFIGPWGRLQSVLAVEELAGMLPLHEAVPLAASRLGPCEFRRWKRGLAAQMAETVRGLHGRGRFHKDLYLCHFYVAEADTSRVPDWRGGVWLIDLHRLGHHPWAGWWWRAKDLGQLLFSSAVPGVTDRDRALFWRYYSGEKRPGWPARLLGAWARLRSWNYHRREKRMPR
jgi:heptose I phosphotransferase